MTQLERSDHIVGSCRDTGNRDEYDHAGNHAEGIKGCWYGKNTQPDLRLHHENHRSEKADLVSR